MKKVLLFSLALFALATVNFAQSTAGKNWESKDVDKWDAGDVRSILEGSAWGRLIRINQSRPNGLPTVVQPPIRPLTPNGSPTYVPPPTNMPDSMGGAVVTENSATFTLRSALPVRLALVRSQQIKRNYDSMSPERKTKFDLDQRSILACSLCEKYYIISISANSRLLQNASLMKSRSSGIYLSNELGEKRTLSNFAPQVEPGGEAMFFFPRFDDKGKPLFTPENSKLIFNFIEDMSGEAINERLRRVEIDIKDIVREGQILF